MAKVMTEAKEREPQPMRLVVLESPFAGDEEYNLAYARACMHDCLVEHGEAPFPSHALYPQPGVLNDSVPEERQLGIQAGFAWGLKADAVVVYTDLGISSGMEMGIAAAEARGAIIEYRNLKKWEEKVAAILSASSS